MRIFSLEHENGEDDEPFDIEETAREEAGEAANATFGEAMEAIQEDSLDPALLTGFSDMTRNDARRLGQVWKDLPEESRVTIAEHVFAIGEDDLMLDFLRFYRLLLDDASAAVRQIAATALRPYEDESLIEPLTKVATSDPESEVRIAAVEALGAFVMQAEFGMLEPKAVKAVNKALASIMTDVAAPQRLRAAALVALAVRGEDAQVAKTIAAFHGSGEPDLHLGAVQAMGRSGADRWLPLLETALRSADPDERQSAAASLANYEDDAVPMLTMAVREDQEAPVRLEAIQSLGTIGGRQALESLQALREYVSDDEVEAVDIAMGEAEALIGLESFEEGDEFAFDEDDVQA